MQQFWNHFYSHSETIFSSYSLSVTDGFLKTKDCIQLLQQDNIPLQDKLFYIECLGDNLNEETRFILKTLLQSSNELIKKYAKETLEGKQIKNTLK